MNIARRIIQGQDQLLIAGILQDLEGLPTTMGLGGTQYTPQEIAAFFQARIDAANRIITARAAWTAAIAEFEELNRRAKVLLPDLRNVLLGNFGPDSEKLSHFGFAPPRRPKLTVEQRRAASEKAKATRKARGTLGKKQKLAIKGTPETVPTAATPTNPST